MHAAQKKNKHSRHTGARVFIETVKVLWKGDRSLKELQTFHFKKGRGSEVNPQMSWRKESHCNTHRHKETLRFMEQLEWRKVNVDSCSEGFVLLREESLGPGPGSRRCPLSCVCSGITQNKGEAGRSAGFLLSPFLFYLGHSTTNPFCLHPLVMTFGDWTQALGLCCKQIYPLRDLTDP